MLSPVSERLPVLIVDDNPADQKWVAIHVAEAWPYRKNLELHYAADGKEALRRIRIGRFALLVVDWRLATMTAAEVLRSLRSRGDLVPALVVSNSPRDVIHEDLDALGAAFIRKSDLNTVAVHRAIAHALALRANAAQHVPFPSIRA